MTNDETTVTELPKKRRRIPRPNRGQVVRYGAAALAGGAAVFTLTRKRAKIDVTIEETEDTNPS